MESSDSKFIKVCSFEHDWAVKSLEINVAQETPSLWIEIEENLLIECKFKLSIFKNSEYVYLDVHAGKSCNFKELFAKASCKFFDKYDSFGDFDSNIYPFQINSSETIFVPISKFKELVKTLENDSTYEDFKVKCKIEFFKRAMEIPNIEGSSTILSRMFNENMFADFTINSQEGIKFKIHKGVLAAESSVFQAMFSNEMQEKKEGVANLEESHKVLKELLSFIYTRKVENLFEVAEPLLIAANKYLIDDLKSICTAEILDQIVVENVIRLMILASEHNAQELEEYAIEFIASNIRAVKATKDWEKFISHDTCATLRNKVIDRILEDINNLKTTIKPNPNVEVSSK